MKRNSSVMILPVDKGRAKQKKLDKAEYEEKFLRMLSDEKKNIRQT